MKDVLYLGRSEEPMKKSCTSLTNGMPDNKCIRAPESPVRFESSSQLPFLVFILFYFFPVSRFPSLLLIPGTRQTLCLSPRAMVANSLPQPRTSTETTFPAENQVIALVPKILICNRSRVLQTREWLGAPAKTGVYHRIRCRSS